MMQLFLESGGYIRWPILVAALFMFGQIGWAAVAVRDPGPGATRRRHMILMWGLLCALLGVLGTMIGMANAARAVGAAGGADPALIGFGLQITLSSSIIGLLLLTVAVTAWLVLQVVHPGGRRPS